MKTPRRSKKPGTPSSRSASSAIERSNALLASIQKDIMTVAKAVSGSTSHLKSLPDEIRSMADVLQSVNKKLILMEFSMVGTADLEAVKTELRLVRSDLDALGKRLDERAVAESPQA